MEALKSANQILEDSIRKVNDEVARVKKERDVLEVENETFKEVNEGLIEDITILNERLVYLIPGKLEEENIELKENLAILKCLSGLNGNIKTVEHIDEDMEIKNAAHYCELCPFESNSQQGLRIHIGMKHKERISSS